MCNFFGLFSGERALVSQKHRVQHCQDVPIMDQAKRGESCCFLCHGIVGKGYVWKNEVPVPVVNVNLHREHIGNGLV